MFDRPLQLRKPGLFITGTDTGVGKTLVGCAIARVLRRQDRRLRVGVCKPLATGCRKDREGLVSEDAEALAHFADCRQALDTINPVRYAPPLAQAMAAEATGVPVDFAAIARSLEWLDQEHDLLLVEGVGGLLVPLDAADPHRTVLDLALALGYPVVVVARAGLGTLNHTAMTVRLLRDAGCTVAGLVVNGFVTDDWSSAAGRREQLAAHPRSLEGRAMEMYAAGRIADLSMAGNRAWLQRMNQVPVLATIPALPTDQVATHLGRLHDAVLDAVAATFWPEVAQPPRPRPGRPGA